MQAPGPAGKRYVLLRTASCRGFVRATGQRRGFHNEVSGHRVLNSRNASGRHSVPPCPSGGAAGQGTDLSPTRRFVAGNKNVTPVSLRWSPLLRFPGFGHSGFLSLARGQDIAFCSLSRLSPCSSPWQGLGQAQLPLMTVKDGVFSRNTPQRCSFIQ